jgi:hypothetical protein
MDLAGRHIKAQPLENGFGVDGDREIRDGEHHVIFRLVPERDEQLLFV